MSDIELMDWLCSHPFVSSYSEPGGVVLSGYATVGRGRDFRSALIDLIANDRMKARGIPCDREREAMVSTGGMLA